MRTIVQRGNSMPRTAISLLLAAFAAVSLLGAGISIEGTPAQARPVPSQNA
jgi:hypothetical protein